MRAILIIAACNVILCSVLLRSFCERQQSTKQLSHGSETVYKTDNGKISFGEIREVTHIYKWPIGVWIYIAVSFIIISAWILYTLFKK